MTSRPQYLTESDRSLISVALLAKAKGDAEIARTFERDNKRLYDEFMRQSSQASLLATMIEDASDMWLTQ